MNEQKTTFVFALNEHEAKTRAQRFIREGWSLVELRRLYPLAGSDKSAYKLFFERTLNSETRRGNGSSRQEFSN